MHLLIAVTSLVINAYKFNVEKKLVIFCNFTLYTEFQGLMQEHFTAYDVCFQFSFN